MEQDELVAASEARDAGDLPSARRALRDVALGDDRLRRWLAAARLLPELRGPGDDVLRVSLVGTSTLDQTARATELAGLIAGLDLVVSTPPYGQYEAAVLDPASSVFHPAPDVVVLLPDLRARPLPVWSPAPEPLIESWVDEATTLWRAIRAKAPGARILQANLVPPPASPVGTLQRTDPRGRTRMVRAINDRLADAADDGVAIVDVATVAEELGRERWLDQRFWFHAKQAVSLAAVPRLARELVKVLAASLGRSRKVVVSDLDDTLWGGTVGEDGVAGLRLEGDAVGEAHLALQQHLRDLRDRGIILAVCSKNDAELARRPFLEREDMILGLDDISAFVANWEPKSENVRRIAEDLDVGLDAVVFLDDNPAEREQVRIGCPLVDVIELPPEPADYVLALDRYPLLDTVRVTDEDAARTEQYRARAQAKALERDAGTFEDYLASLDMTAEITRLDEATLPRVVQLLGKTNQWNLTTRRHDTAAVERMLTDPEVIALTARLQDRFGDHGLVALAIARLQGEQAIIDSLLMSCRVIGRRLEYSLVAELAAAVAAKGARTLVGEYLPTARNGLVAGLYPSMGFAPAETGPSGSRWSIGLAAARELATPFIRIQARPESTAPPAEHTETRGG